LTASPGTWSKGAEHSLGPERIRVAVAHPHFTYPGGAGAVALETSERLAARGYDLHVITLRHDPRITSAYPSVRFHDIGGFISSDIRYWLLLPWIQRRFAYLVGKIRPHVLIAHVFPANYWPFLYRTRWRDIPCVWYCHEPSAFVHDYNVIRGLDWPMRLGALAVNPFLQLFDRWAVRHCNVFLTNSRYTAGRINRIYGRAAIVANPGVNTRPFEPARPKDRLVLTVARLTKFKQVDLFLQAASLLQRQGYTDVRWLVIGDGEDRERLTQLAERLGVARMIEFAGQLERSQLIAYYNRALLVAVTAPREPFGIVPLEAMAAGAAVVCSDTGGPAETVVHGVTGFHFHAGDASDLASRIKYLLDHPAVAQSMGDAGRQRAQDSFSWEGTTDRLDDAVRGLVLGSAR
jgi:glycosyltransferase involved in cell wall biosynthesis